MSEYAHDVVDLQRELAAVSGKIDCTMREIATIRHPMMEDDRVHGAVDELGAIVVATEVATGEILDVAEQLEEVAAAAVSGTGEPLGPVLTGLTTRLFEACSFQDVTGQRLEKVTALLRDIDQRLVAIIERLGKEAFMALPPPAATEGDTALLNGPAKHGLPQDSIDALFS